MWILLLNISNLVSAESYLNDALVSYQSVYGPSHKQTLETQDELAKVMLKTDRKTVSRLNFHRPLFNIWQHSTRPSAT